VFLLVTSVEDPNPGSGAFLTFGSGIRNGKNPDSGMNISDHISESLETIFWVKIFYVDPEPESGMEKFGSGNRNKHLRSATLPVMHKISINYFYSTPLNTDYKKVL
jgi:hypothetical protein